jgi:hypothetical protein
MKSSASAVRDANAGGAPTFGGLFVPDCSELALLLVALAADEAKLCLARSTTPTIYETSALLVAVGEHGVDDLQIAHIIN